MSIQKKSFVLGVAILIGTIVWILEPTEPDTHTRRFCAYGHVYVEFEQNGKIWGTTFLDEDGKPIGCREDDIPKSPASITNKGII